MKIEKYNNIFLAVIGITPQVLTECLFYYYSPYYKQNRKFDKIKIFTTLEGKKKLINKLFNENQLTKLENALKLKNGSIPFNKTDIILFKDINGNPINDIRTTEENEESLKILHNELKKWTSDKNTRVTATVAGGRKTMSTQMALAFQLFAREHDELIHIIPPNDKMDFNNPESQTWFFPSDPKNPTEKLDVSKIPVLRIGRYLSNDLDLPIPQLINKIQSQIIQQAPIKELKINGTLFLSGKEVLKLSPLLSSYFRYFLKRRLKSNCKIDCNGCKSCFIQNADLPNIIKNEILIDHESLYTSRSGHFAKTKETRKIADYFECINMIKTDISNLKSSIRKSQISSKFKNAIMVKSLKLEIGNNQLKWHGISMNSKIIEFIK
jgi:CRISPR-associated protein (TIGR02584 family)